MVPRKVGNIITSYVTQIDHEASLKRTDIIEQKG